jgi:polyhydroxyalkanoate synthase
MDDACRDAEEWASMAKRKDGSWWEDWVPWLTARSSPEPVPAPPMGATDKGYAPVDDAPGTYVFQR